MLRIRFLKQGKKNQPFFRLVVTEKENPPKGGRFLEILGFFNPSTKEKSLKKERIEYWISVGAKPSDRVHNLLVEEKIIKGKKIPVHSRRKRKKEEKKEEAPKEEKKETKEEPVKEQAPVEDKKQEAEEKAPEERKKDTKESK